MEKMMRYCFAALTIQLLLVSCGKSTEKYAQKEHGMKFDAWELNYRANSYDVYWPKLVLVDQNEGHSRMIETDFVPGWIGRVRRDTTETAAYLLATIVYEKNRNDAKYEDIVKFNVLDSDKRYYSDEKYSFVFNESQQDSICFATVADEGDFVPDREISARIISLLCKEEPTTLRVTYKNMFREGDFTFVINGSPKLKKGIAINRERKLLAEKEYKIARGKSQK